jgi:predicted transposase YbfD/YdcC
LLAIDGKTVRHSGRKGRDAAPIPRVSACAARQRLRLGPVKGTEQSTAIMASPKLLHRVAIAAALVTIAAMGCPRDRAQIVREKKAADGRALNGNPGSLHEDGELVAAEPKAKAFTDTDISQDTAVAGAHRRIERRTTPVIHDAEWLQKRHEWPGLKAIVMLESSRAIGGKIEPATRFYLTSPGLLAVLRGPIVRRHGALETSLHWVRDRGLHDAAGRVRTDPAAANFTPIKHRAHHRLRRAATKASSRLRRKAAACDDEFLARLVAR